MALRTGFRDRTSPSRNRTVLAMALGSTREMKRPSPPRLVGGVILGAAALAFGCGPESHAPCDDEVCLDEGPCLAPAEVFPLEMSALHLVAARFDDDDAIDILVLGVDDVANVVAQLFLGDGEGDFADPVPIGAIGCSAYPSIGDLDGDDAPDLVYADCDGALLVFWGTPTGPGDVSTTVPLGFRLSSSAASDVDGDGIDDLVIVGRDAADAPQFVWVRGAADRALTPAAAGMALGLPFAPSGVRASPVAADGTLDAVVFAPDVPDGVAVADADALGVFGPMQPLPIGARVGLVTLGAFGADTDETKLLVTSPQDTRLVLADTAGSAIATLLFPYRPAFATPVDWDDAPGDEALVIDGVDPEIRWFRFGSDGVAEDSGRIPTPHAAQYVVTPDLDGDAVPDLVVGHYAGSAFSVRLARD